MTGETGSNLTHIPGTTGILCTCILAAAILHSLSAQPRVIIVSIKGAGAHLQLPSFCGCPVEYTSLDILGLVFSRAYVHGFNRVREEKETVLN